MAAAFKFQISSFRFLFALFCFFIAPVAVRAQETAFWTWHRADPLGDAERAGILAYGAHTVYWHAGEMENRTGQWRWKNPPALPQASTDGLRVIPVIRLSSFVDDPFTPAAVEELARKIRAIAPNGAQVDMDCPDRLLPEFAGALKAIRARLPWLSVTALEGWCRKPAWGALQSAVDEIVPMFYDTQIDPPVTGAEGPGPLPLADAGKVRRQLAGWSGCKAKWRAGLPLFSRLTIYDHASGKSLGHIRDWSWDELCFNRDLETAAPTALGVTLLRATQDTTVANTPLKKGDLLGVRWPDRAALSQAITLTRESGAAGILFFRLPDSTAPSGWSLKQLARLDAAPVLALHRLDGFLELTNTSEADLAPRLSGKNPHDRGYALELESDAPVFREAVEGDFWRVSGYAGEEGKLRPAALPLATHVIFRFSQVRAGQSLRTGLIQLAPGADFSHIRYRILNQSPDAPWQKITD